MLQDDETPKHEDEVVAALQLALNRTTIRPPPLEAEERCRLSKGDWCTQYMLQVGYGWWAARGQRLEAGGQAAAARGGVGEWG